MTNNVVTFKGVSEGIYINIEGNDFQKIKDQLDKKIKASSEFFKGVKLLGVKGDLLSEEEIIEIKLILKYKYDFDISFEELPNYINPVKDEDSDYFSQGKVLSEGIEEGMTKFVYGTLRSGQFVEYNGNIVVIGDVNPGAVLKAKGHIIVLGTLRGMAQVGIDGSTDSIVAAYNLIPTQLRIGNIIVRPPDGDISQYKLPELAKIVNGEVIIEPYLPNK